MSLEQFKNKLIVFEGGDKVSKTSVAKLLEEYLNEHQIETVFTFQPGDDKWGPLASLTKSLCKDLRWDLHPLANFFAFQFDRVMQVDKVVIPALEAGKTVISDRWNYSTYAYQLFGKELATKYNMPEDVLTWLLKTAVLDKEPDYVFYFPQKLEVKREENPNDMFEKSGDAFYQRVHEAYERLSDKYNFIKVYPGKSAEETMHIILGLI
jgi:dTMP kinase